MHTHRLCISILTTFYHMCHLLYSATGDVVKVVHNCKQWVMGSINMRTIKSS